MPAPTRSIPVLIGGTGPRKTMRLVARHADSWHAMFPEHPAELDTPVVALEGWCSEIGRDPHDIGGLGLEPDDRRRVLEDHADTLHGRGFTQFTIGATGPDYSFDVIADWLAWRDDKNRERSGAVR